MVTPEQLFIKHFTRALVSTGIVMVVILVISIMAKTKFIGDAPLAAGVVTAVFSCALHSAIKEAHELYSQEQDTSTT